MIITIKKLQNLYNKLNLLIFKNFLPHSSEINFEIFEEKRSNKDLWAYCEYIKKTKKFKLYFSEDIDNTSFLKQIMTHEMIHIYQYLNYYYMSHGKKTFFMWKRKLSKHKINLYEKN